MSLWQFSESSQPLLNRCLEASTIDPDNKWVKRFGHLLGKKSSEKIVNESQVIVNLCSEDTNIDSQQTVVIEPIDIDNEILQEAIDANTEARYDAVVEICLKNNRLYSELAKQLPITSLEKLCLYIFNNIIHVNPIFLNDFYSCLLPEFIIRDQSRLSIDILIKAEKCNCELFKKLLETIIIDVELPSQILQQFIPNLDDRKQFELLQSFLLSNISNNAFIHHLPSIHMLYKNCPKTVFIQEYLLLKLSNTSHLCVNDKNYGRLLLNYLQAQKNFDTNHEIVQKIINEHKSLFKKPCLTAANELKNQMTNRM